MSDLYTMLTAAGGTMAGIFLFILWRVNPPLGTFIFFCVIGVVLAILNNL